MSETQLYSQIVTTNTLGIANLQPPSPQVISNEINHGTKKKQQRHNKKHNESSKKGHRNSPSPIIIESDTKPVEVKPEQQKPKQLEPEMNDISTEFKSIKDVTNIIFGRVYNLESNLKEQITEFRNEQIGFKLQQENYKDIELDIKKEKNEFKKAKETLMTEKEEFAKAQTTFEIEKEEFAKAQTTFEIEKEEFAKAQTTFEIEKEEFELESSMFNLPPNILGFKPKHIVDFSTLNIQQQEIFNIETINIFTINQICWVLPTSSAVGDLIVFKNPIAELELLVRIYCILPTKSVNVAYTLFGDTCVFCCKP
jgi:hypothetical protein